MKVCVLTSCLVAMFVCFVAIGCGTIYKAMGLPPEKVTEQTAKDEVVIVEAIEQGRDIIWPIVSTAMAGVGAMTSGLLLKWLSMERRITGAMIAGVEKSNDGNAKQAITVESLKRGVGMQLNKRVRKLT